MKDTRAIYRKKLEDLLGRRLNSDEIVHHKDGNSHNNDISNLEIVTQSEHAKRKHLTSEDWEKAIGKLLTTEEMNMAQTLNGQLSMFFTERQKELILRKFYKLPFTKTENEYYSRIVKKKLVALANPILYKIVHFILY